MGGAWWFPDGWFLREPGALLKALSDGFEAAGGELHTGPGMAVKGIDASPGGEGVRLRLEQSAEGLGSQQPWFDADEVVVACGAHSASLARYSRSMPLEPLCSCWLFPDDRPLTSSRRLV